MHISEGTFEWHQERCLFQNLTEEMKNKQTQTVKDEFSQLVCLTTKTETNSVRRWGNARDPASTIYRANKSSHGHQSRCYGVNLRPPWGKLGDRDTKLVRMFYSMECETTGKYNAKTSFQKHCQNNEKSYRCTNPVVSDQTVKSLRSRPFRAPMRFWPLTRCIGRHKSVSRK